MIEVPFFYPTMVGSSAPPRPANPFAFNPEAAPFVPSAQTHEMADKNEKKDMEKSVTAKPHEDMNVEVKEGAGKARKEHDMKIGEHNGIVVAVSHEDTRKTTKRKGDGDIRERHDKRTKM